MGTPTSSSSGNNDHGDEHNNQKKRSSNKQLQLKKANSTATRIKTRKERDKEREREREKKRKKKNKHRHGGIFHVKRETNKLLQSKQNTHSKFKDKTSKSDTTKKFLKKLIKEEVLFTKLPDAMLNRMVRQMYRVDIPAGKCVVSAGTPADAYFIIEKGSLEVLYPETHRPRRHKHVHSESDDLDSDGVDKTGKHSYRVKDILSAGDTFGGDKLLYADTYHYSYRAQATPSKDIFDFDSCRCWALDQETFDEIRKSQAIDRATHTNKLTRFLQKIPMFKDMLTEDLQTVSDAMMRMNFRKNEKIVYEGDSSTHFFIIYRGTCVATKKKIKSDSEQKSTENENAENDSLQQLAQSADELILKSYTAGDCFGELGIMKSQSRAATIRVTSNQLVAYALPALDFKALLDFDDVKETMNNKISQYSQIPDKYENRVKCKLDEFVEIGCLGVGAFGRVTLVEDPQDKSVYALKRVRKNRIVETSQQEHIINEKRIMSALDSPFCIRLYATFKDELNVYFLLEPVMGGELFSLLRHEKRLAQRTAIFYAANVVLAFEYLHSKLNVIYRDLKPENLLISNNGYCKLVDFGFAKKRNNTCTLCGTPQYLAPEVIQNLSHGFAVDWWAVGILIYEMMFGFPPFEGDKKLKMYEKILTAPVEFPEEPKIKDYSRDIITSFLRKQAHKRLGAGAKGADLVKKHPFFKRIDWVKMYKQQERAPWCPRINGAHDLSAFDRFPDTSPENETLIEDPTGELFAWCEEF